MLNPRPIRKQFSIPDPNEDLTPNQCFGSGSVLDPDSIRSVDPDPYSESGSRTKMTQKSRNNFEISCFEVLDVLFRAEGFSCYLDVLCRGLLIFFSAVNFFCNFWSSKPWIRIRSGSVFSLKCWIRIRIKLIQIRNTDPNPPAGPPVLVIPT